MEFVLYLMCILFFSLGINSAKLSQAMKNENALDTAYKGIIERGDFGPLISILASSYTWQTIGASRIIPEFRPFDNDVIGFFMGPGAEHEFTEFDYTWRVSSATSVVYRVFVAGANKHTGKSYPRTAVIHIWEFDNKGKVISFKEYEDTALFLDGGVYGITPYRQSLVQTWKIEAIVQGNLNRLMELYDPEVEVTFFSGLQATYNQTGIVNLYKNLYTSYSDVAVKVIDSVVGTGVVSSVMFLGTISKPGNLGLPPSSLGKRVSIPVSQMIFVNDKGRIIKEIQYVDQAALQIQIST